MASLLDRVLGAWDEWQWERRRGKRLVEGKRPCPCCGYLTLEFDSGDYEICHVCYWEDDPIQLDDPDYEGGANKVSLNQARESYRRHGVSELEYERYVRPARPEEIPSDQA